MKELFHRKVFPLENELYRTSLILGLVDLSAGLKKAEGDIYIEGDKGRRQVFAGRDRNILKLCKNIWNANALIISF